MPSIKQEAERCLKWGETDIPGVFAAGDIVSGPKTVVEAIAFTKRVFERMEQYLAKPL